MNKITPSLLFFLLASLAGCISSSPLERNYSVVTLFYATDRAIDDKSELKSYFGAQRGALVYGQAKVSIPHIHQIGELTPSLFARFNFRQGQQFKIGEHPEMQVMLLDITPNSKQEYYAQLASSLALENKKTALLYVHGYNVSFEKAAQRSAQMAHDLRFKGVTAFYSWPSHANPSKYTFDEVNIEWSEANLKAFLTDFLSQSDVENVYLLGHSMGNRALINAYIDVAKNSPSLSAKVKEVILAAPDIDMDVFKRDLAPSLARAGSPVTLYASSQDYALKASKAVHGGYARAGDSGENILIAKGIETIDATAAKASPLGHSSHADAPLAIEDMHYLIEKRMRANSRFGLMKIQSVEGQYWLLK